MASPHVLIAGAGLAGSALALALQQRNITSALIDRRHKGDCEGAGLLLTPNALAALDRIGAGTRIRESGREVRHICYLDSNGNELFAIDTNELGWPGFLSIEHSALRQGLLAEIDTDVRHDCTITAVNDLPGSAVALSDGDKVNCDLIVGADGYRSDFRENLFCRGAAKCIRDFVGYRFIAENNCSISDSIYLLGNGCTLLMHPLKDGRLFAAAGPISPELIDDKLPPIDNLRRIFGRFRGPAPALLDSLSERTRFIRTRYWQVATAVWHTRRCLLVGDAAHALAPTLAQGAAMAFEDACIAADALSETKTVDQALKRYESRRRSRVELVQRESLQRMEANIKLTEKDHQLRLKAVSLTGHNQLTRVWSSLFSIHA